MSEEHPFIRYFNRELSWLNFNERVLHQARDPQTPLLERVRFLSIFTSNLDEFFMKRVGYLKRVIGRGLLQVGHEGSNPIELERLIREKVHALLEVRTHCFYDEIVPALAEQGVVFLSWKDLSESEKQAAQDYSRQKVFPILTPLAVDPAHPFPFLSNLSVSLGVRLQHPQRKDHMFARIKVPSVIPQWVLIEGETSPPTFRLLSLVDLITHNLDELFPEMEILNVMPFRVTRNADIDLLSDDVEDLVDVVEEELRQRRVASVVRLECADQTDTPILEMLQEELEITPADIYQGSGELNHYALNEIAALPLPQLKYPPHHPVVPAALHDEGVTIFKSLAERDVLVHHPYESFNASVLRFIEEAVNDPHVLAIKMTLYRAGENSPIIPLLIEAAEKGKQVVVVVELKARFDEARNIYWAEMLEKAGVHVAYGMVGKKVHSKIILVIRREGQDYRMYGHVGTGNYNADTARFYTDIGLFTCDPQVTSEMIDIFNFLTGLSLKKNYKKFLVAPLNMEKRFLDLIQAEAEQAKNSRPARIMAKMNSLEDQRICDALYEASQAGVKIDLIVRGFCTIRPGVKGLSENIQVRSAIGRFLEHSRIFYFQSGKSDPLEGLFLMGSADWMYRNLNNRIETILPVTDLKNKKECWKILTYMLEDQQQTWQLLEDGTYHPPAPVREEGLLGVHDRFIARYKKRSEKQKKKRGSR